jgi:hypothetical protein
VSPSTTNIREVAASNAIPDGSVPATGMLPTSCPLFRIRDLDLALHSRRRRIGIAVMQT